MGQMQRTPGRHITRRLEQPWGVKLARHQPGRLAKALTNAHNDAVRTYGSDCAGFHAFNPVTRSSAGVWDGNGGFPADTVVTPMVWGRIDATLAQRLLEADGVDTTVSETVRSDQPIRSSTVDQTTIDPYDPQQTHPDPAVQALIEHGWLGEWDYPIGVDNLEGAVALVRDTDATNGPAASPSTLTTVRDELRDHMANLSDKQPWDNKAMFRRVLAALESATEGR